MLDLNLRPAARLLTTRIIKLISFCHRITYPGQNFIPVAGFKAEISVNSGSVNLNQADVLLRSGCKILVDMVGVYLSL